MFRETLETVRDTINYIHTNSLQTKAEKEGKIIKETIAKPLTFLQTKTHLESFNMTGNFEKKTS